MLLIKEFFVRVLFLLFGVFVSVLFSSAFMGCGSDTLSFKDEAKDSESASSRLKQKEGTGVDQSGDFVEGKGSLQMSSSVEPGSEKAAVAGTIVKKDEKSQEQREKELLAYCEGSHDNYMHADQIESTVRVLYYYFLVHRDNHKIKSNCENFAKFLSVQTVLGPFDHIPWLNFNNPNEVLYSKIESLQPFLSLTQLKKLDLSGHDIKNLNGIEELSKLNYINLSNNKITIIDELKFLQNIKEVNLSNNLIRRIPSFEDVFKHLINLESLNLSSNKIIEPQIELSRFPPSLIRLDLSRNFFQQVSFKIEHNSNLISDPRTNFRMRYPYHRRKGLPKLETLNLSNNESLSKISGFNKLHSLKEFDLSNTDIKHHGAEDLLSMTSLRSLNIKDVYFVNYREDFSNEKFIDSLRNKLRKTEIIF